MEPVARVPNPHDEHLRLCWKICRYGAKWIVEDEGKRRTVLAWLDRMDPLFPGSPWLAGWREIVAGDRPEFLRELEGTQDFFDLPFDRQGFWRPLIQSQPFTCIFPGKTTRERRAVLSRLP